MNYKTLESQYCFFCRFFSVTKNSLALFYVLAWPPSPFSVSLQGMSSDSEKDCQVIETKILSDEKWFKSLDDSERQLLEKNKIPFEELEDKKVVCTACFQQGNHKQTVSNACEFDRKVIIYH